MTHAPVCDRVRQAKIHTEALLIALRIVYTDVRLKHPTRVKSNQYSQCHNYYFMPHCFYGALPEACATEIYSQVHTYSPLHADVIALLVHFHKTGSERLA